MIERSQLKVLQIVTGLYQFDGLILLEFDSEKANNSLFNLCLMILKPWKLETLVFLDSALQHNVNDTGVLTFAI